MPRKRSLIIRPTVSSRVIGMYCIHRGDAKKTETDDHPCPVWCPVRNILNDRIDSGQNKASAKYSSFSNKVDP